MSISTSTLPAQLRSQVCVVARQAGHFIREQISQFSSGDIEVKDHNSLVSYVDIEAEKIIVAGLREAFPLASFLTEENTVQGDRESEWTWIIDPLDGTTNFIHDLPYFSVSIALRYQSDYVLGVVYDVMQDDMYAAQRGEGAVVNDVPIKVATTEELADAVMATGFPYNSFEWMERYLNLFRELFQRTRGVRRFGSAALDLCYVARGRFGGFYEYGLNEWDIAAGICIVREAGGRVTSFEGGDDVHESGTILATNGILHPDVLDLLDRHFKA